MGGTLVLLYMLYGAGDGHQTDADLLRSWHVVARGVVRPTGNDHQLGG